MVTHTRSGFVAPKETTLLQTPASLLQDEVLTLFAPLRKNHCMRKPQKLGAEATEKGRLQTARPHVMIR